MNSEWNVNKQWPVLDVEAFVVSKRTNTTFYHQSNGTDTKSKDYYVTFQVESKDWMSEPFPAIFLKKA